MSEQERQDLDLEDIIKEFGTAEEEPNLTAEEDAGEPEVLLEEPELEEEPVSEKEPEEIEEDIALDDMDLTEDPEIAKWLEESQQEQEDLQETIRMEPVKAEDAEEGVTGDTIRLDGLRDKLAAAKTQEVRDAAPVEEEPENLEDTVRSEPFTERWEPEYDQPMGEYVPPQPIQFQPRSRLRELKRKLVAGPEKRFYDLSEKGVGKLQAAIFVSLLLVLIAAASTAMYAFGAVQENRLRLMVFGQFWVLLMSALLGSFQMIEGITDLFKKRFTLNTLLVVTFLMCCVDGVLCLKQLRVPCCAAFSLEVTMSLWGAYHRRSTEMAQMDTMRKAIRLDGVTAYPDYLDGKKGLLRTEGQVEDFMDHYAALGKWEKRLNLYGLIAMCVGLAIGVFAGVLKGITDGVMNGISVGVQVAAVSLLAAVPATAFISQSRPAWILERRLHRLGTVLCGWKGIEGLCGKAVFPIAYGDLFPVSTVRMNGVKFFGNREPEQIVAYASAVVAAEGSGLTDIFNQVLESYSGWHYEAQNLSHYANGGIGATVEDEAVLMGSATFMKEMDIEVPESSKVNYGVYIAIEGELCGLFAVSYEKTKSATAGLSTLNSYRKLHCVLTSDDFMLTHGFLKSKFGVKPKRFLLPEHEVRRQLREVVPAEDASALLMTTAMGLAPIAYGVTGARILKTTCRLGTVLHVIGGIVGLAIMALLVWLGALDLLSPVNMFLYQLVWMLPALLITEWTRSV